MTAKSVLMRLQGLRLGARAPTCLPLLRYCSLDPTLLMKSSYSDQQCSVEGDSPILKQ